MDALGWTLIEAGKYAARVESDEDHFAIHLTDLALLWCERLNSNQILKRCEELNPSVEATVDNLKKQLLGLISSNKDTEIIIEEEKVTLKLKSYLDKFPFVWEFYLTLETPLKFCALITLPLLKMVKESFAIQEELSLIIRNKDKQIDDYKSSGATVSRRYLETKEFDSNRFFAERKWHTIKDGFKENSVNLFCEVVDRFAKLSGDAVERTTSKGNVQVLHGSVMSAEPKTTEGGSTPIKSPVKETEADRLEALQKRLREEELNELAKRRKRPKKF